MPYMAETPSTDGTATPANGTAAPVNKLIEQVSRTPGREPSPQPTRLSVPGATHSRTLHEEGTGYVAPVFEGKEKQMEQVMELVEEKAFIPVDFVESETKWFYTELGIDDMYFSTESVEAISSHIHSLYAAKIAAYARDDKRLEIRLDKEAADHAVYIDTSKPGVSAVDGPHYEQRIDEKYLDPSDSKKAFRLETFRSMSGLPGVQDASLRCYFLYECDFVNPNPAVGETSIDVIGDKRFLQKATPNTKEIYQEVIKLAADRSGPVIEYFDIQGRRDKRVVIAFKQGTALGFFSALSDLYHYYGLTSSRKYVEQFANGVTVVSIYLRHPEDGATRQPPIEASIRQIVKEISLLYCIPQNTFQKSFAMGELSLQETIYAHSCWVFVHHFLNRLGTEYKSLVSLLDIDNSAHAELISKIKRRLRNETFTSNYIREIINQYPTLVRALYLSFANKHYVQSKEGPDDFLPTLSYLRLKVDKVLDDSELERLIATTVGGEHHALVMTAFRVFNNSLLKTNFYTPTKVALSFRFRPDFLPEEEYPKALFGMFLVIGAEFRAFHLRFKDVARGGIRIVRSRNAEAYAINARSLFDENYNLANTQARKNKDIPEGGSKGVILLDYQHQKKGPQAFHKYIDSIMDLLLPPTTPGIKDPIVDLYGKEEILFMGPDENTADLVDSATEHARKRGAPWWKSFFTGKSATLGGIPHDRYGMTTLSVRGYVEGIYRKLQLDPSKLRKMQTGGPDGDLGSNEILLGNEKWTAVVDGSGCLADPNGIDKEELVRLAKARLMISHFDMSKLSDKGWRCLTDETNVKIPTGEVISNGRTLLATFHRRDPSQYDVFVPCGGRPESIDISNVNDFIKNGKASIPYIVEGANLFISQDARIRLEKAGCILFKDASTNKGGVTSSSLEVLASLCFDDAGFLEHMCTKPDGTVPEFYTKYVNQVQEIVKKNAELEFEALWRENEKTGTPRSILSDTLSLAILELNYELEKTELWNDVKLRKSVMMDALPSTLLDKLGLDIIMERVPTNYLRSIFGAYLACKFVYEYGPSPGQFAFFEFMRKKMAELGV